MDEEPLQNPRELLPSERALWAALIRTRCGLDFEGRRAHQLASALTARLHARHLTDYGAYYHYLVYNPEGGSEWDTLVELLLNHETSFFRHAPAFAAFERHVLPELVARKQMVGDQRLTLWSAGCSKGQEVYSLAMIVAKNLDLRQWRVELVGTDLGNKVLAQARSGRYRAHELRQFPDGFRKFLTAHREGNEEIHEVDAHLRKMARFDVVNLMATEAPPLSNQDVIFCQNVLMYFSVGDRKRVAANLSGCLAPGGWLFLTPGDVFGLQLAGMEQVNLDEALIYRRPLGAGDTSGTTNPVDGFAR